MPRRVIAKWRPPLALVLGGTLAAVFFLPIIGIAYFRVAGGVLGWAETSWMIAGMAYVATVLLGYLLWRLVLQPTRVLTAYARRDGEGPPPEHFGTPEFSELGQAVLDMTATLRGREAVLRSYADHVTHELKSPLSAIRGAAELLQDDKLPAADRARLQDNITIATGRMEALLEDQRAFARAHEPLATGTSILSELVAGWPKVTVTQDGELPLSREVMQIVTSHLVNNATTHGASEVTMGFDGAKLRVADDGPGISKGNRDRVFDPFFTTNRDGGGTGMGLAIVQRLLAAHDAEITLMAEPGAIFEIRF